MRTKVELSVSTSIIPTGFDAEQTLIHNGNTLVAGVTFNRNASNLFGSFNINRLNARK